MLPLPLKPSHTNYCVTCGKSVCMGCVIGSFLVHKSDGRDIDRVMKKAMECPLCRSDTENFDVKWNLKQIKKLANTGNHEAMSIIGDTYYNGDDGLQQDKAEGLKWYYRALEAGSGHAAFNLGGCYLRGDSVERDIEKALKYSQKAVDLGYIPAFYTIANVLLYKGEIEEGMLNLRKAVMCGGSENKPFTDLRNGFKHGFISKDEYAFTLREHQKACNEMKSDERKRFKVMCMWDEPTV